MYHILVRSLMYAMKLSDISHAVGVVSRYMENPGIEVKWLFRYFRGTSIAYAMI
jgi:hypothetical protein